MAVPFSLSRRCRLTQLGLVGSLLTLNLSGIGAPAQMPSAPLADAAPVHPLHGRQLVTDQGQRFDAKVLQGKTVLLNFIFTACTDTCPTTTLGLREVEQQLNAKPGSVTVVSVTVDPLQDTPEALRRFRQRHRIDSPNWVFLTGSADQIEQLVGYWVPKRPGKADLAAQHLSSVFLIDGTGRVIGRLPGTPVDVPRTLREVRNLSPIKPAASPRA